MTTTFEKIEAGVGPLWQRNRNYASLPTKDVEVIDPKIYHCKRCGGVIEPAEVRHGFVEKWKHVNGEPEEPHWVGPRTTCSYCGTDDPELVTFKLNSWSDDTNCTRCGGYLGFPIGD